jgi:hypothetical protein
MSDHVTPARIRDLFVCRDAGLYWRNPTDRATRGPVGSRTGDKSKPGGQRLQVQIKLADGRRTAVYVHRAVWAWHHDEWPVGQVDHINGDVDDNRIENLRVVTNSENSQNVRRSGVTFEQRKVERPWRARIMVNGRSISLGYHDSRAEAEAEYERAKLVYHPAYHSGVGRAA